MGPFGHFIIVWTAIVLLCCPYQPATAQDSASAPTPSLSERLAAATRTESGQVIINELMPSNRETLKDEDGNTPDWVELYNIGPGSISLLGYQLTDEEDGSEAWTFPAVSIDAGEYLLVYLDGKDIAEAGRPLHSSFRLSKDKDYLALLNSDGSPVNVVYYPIGMQADVSFGNVGGEGVVTAAQGGNIPTNALVASPTPQKPNTGPRPGGPLILRTTQSPVPRPTGEAGIVVSTRLQPQQNPVDAAILVYTVNYGPEQSLKLADNPDGSSSATIPAEEVNPGSLVRWYIQATDTVGEASRDPPFFQESEKQFYGTIVADSKDGSSLFVLEIYCPDASAPLLETPTRGCSLQINNTYYDNIEISRRGVTSLQWPKPKIKIDSKQGKIFHVLKGWRRVGEMNLNSHWSEPGENTFMREPLVWKTFGEAGVTSIVSFNMHVRFNGEYYGKFGFVEQIDEDTLQDWGYSVNDVGPLWKSTSGEFSNLRWDVDPNNVQFYWKKYTRKSENDNQALLDFTRGLAGGGPVVRSKYLFDAVNLPQVVNHMAAQTMILNQDRCTKNFYVYLDLSSQQWSMIPWDVESGFGIDRGLGGAPAPDYCILACEQWNSPLYCDRNHPQDLAVRTPWGLISAQYPTYFTGRRRLQGGTKGCKGGGGGDLLKRAARRLMQDSPGNEPTVLLLDGNAGAPPNGAGAAGLTLPENSTIGADYDANQVALGNTITGAPGTFNYLIDAILTVPRTRQMYMRRLRTLMNEFIATGRLEELVTQMHNEIREEALRDVAKWNNPGNPVRGYQQLMTEQLPIRRQQLFETYSLSGSIPLIPDSQPSSPELFMGSVGPGSGSYVEVVNPNNFAVDISGYSLKGSVQYDFRPGTVIPAKDSVYVASDINAFKARDASPTGGEGHFVVGPFGGAVLGPAASVTLANRQGDVIASN